MTPLTLTTPITPKKLRVTLAKTTLSLLSRVKNLENKNNNSLFTLLHTNLQNNKNDGICHI